MSKFLDKICGRCSNMNFCRERGINGPCSEWNISFEYYIEIGLQAPWYIIDKYNKLDCSWGEVLDELEKEHLGQPIDINLYDAIERVYGLNSLSLSDVLCVPVSVVERARSRYTPEKRIDHFATTLKIPVDFFINSLIKICVN